MSTHRVYSGGFVVMPNEAINDDRLSFRARGLLGYMLARPPSWRFSAKRISQETVEGREAVASALRELSRLGYYRVRRMNTGTAGRFAMVTEVAALPSLMPCLDTEDGLPGPGGPGPGGPGPGEAGPYVSTESHHRESSVGSTEVDQATEASA